MKRFISLICVVLISGGGLLGACCPPNEKEPLEIQSETTVLSMANGMAVSLTLFNHSDQDIYYGEMYMLDVFKEDGWLDIPVKMKEPHFFLSLLYLIEPGQDVPLFVNLSWIDYQFEPGTYRLCLRYHFVSDQRSERSAFFEFTLLP